MECVAEMIANIIVGGFSGYVAGKTSKMFYLYCIKEKED